MAQKATTLEQFAMLANTTKNYTDVQIQNTIELIQQESSYTHTQSSAASSWVVTHNLNRYPSVSVVDSSGNLVTGEVRYTSVNSVTITFSAPFSGTAYLN